VKLSELDSNFGYVGQSGQAGFGAQELEGGHWLAVTGRQRDATVSRPSDATVTNKKMGSAAFDSPDRRVQRDEPTPMDGCSPARIVSLDKAKLDMRLASART